MSVMQTKADVWQRIAYYTGIAGLDSLPLVSKIVREGFLIYLKEHILPTLASITTPQGTLIFEDSVIQQFYRLRQGKIFNHTSWIRPIHVLTKNVLDNITECMIPSFSAHAYEKALTNFKFLLQVGADVNAPSEQSEIPLLSVCKKVATFFSSEFVFMITMLEEQDATEKKIHGRILELLSLLLNAGADPNVQQAPPSTSLLTILPKKVLGKNRLELKSTVIDMLIKQGAHPPLP